MQIHDIQRLKIKRKRVGRGGKRGTYSGKGQKGQRSRAGHSLPRTAILSIMKMPKLRGIKNKSRSPKTIILSLDRLHGLGLKEISPKTLAEKNIIKNTKTPVKILNMGAVKKVFVVSGVQVSKNAKEKIEKAGGSVK